MYQVVQNKAFKKAYKRVSKSGDFKIAEFQIVISHLIEGTKLPHKYKNHMLSGKLQYLSECHIQSDVLLIYEIDEDGKTITLSDIGSHSELFG